MKSSASRVCCCDSRSNASAPSRVQRHGCSALVARSSILRLRIICASPASPRFESDRTPAARPHAALPRLPLQHSSPPESTPSLQDHFEAGPQTGPANAFSSPGLPATHFESDLHTPTPKDPSAVGNAVLPRLSPSAASMNTARLTAHAADFAYANALGHKRRCSVGISNISSAIAISNGIIT